MKRPAAAMTFLTVARNTILLGALLTILGMGTYALVGFGPDHLNMLAPAFLGLLFLILGFLARRRARWNPSIMYLAVLLAIVGFVVTVPGLVEMLTFFVGGQAVHRPTSVEHGVSAVLCLGFVVRSVMLLLDNRHTHIREHT